MSSGSVAFNGFRELSRWYNDVVGGQITEVIKTYDNPECTLDQKANEGALLWALQVRSLIALGNEILDSAAVLAEAPLTCGKAKIAVPSGFDAAEVINVRLTGPLVGPFGVEVLECHCEVPSPIPGDTPEIELTVQLAGVPLYEYTVPIEFSQGNIPPVRENVLVDLTPE